jgi:aminoglycoside phosphotransferase (APT) family kinase protein
MAVTTPHETRQTTSLPGLDLAALGEYLKERHPTMLAGPLRGRVIAGGKSNLTYDVTDGVGRWVVRRPPLGHVLATAHDMSREYTVMSALQGTAVPVPLTLELCNTPEILGAPFYVMSWSDGATYRWRDELEPLGPERVERISRAMVSTLVDLHAVDYEASGLADFGRPDGYLERQVRRWGRQFDASRSRDLAGVDELRQRLEAGVPSSSGSGIVHGDFRLDNLLVGEADQVTAVLDWEMAALGDPLADVALMLAYDTLARNEHGHGIANASTAPGFLAKEQVLDIYSKASGRDVSDIGFHLGLAFFKLAVILEGIHYRFTQGQTVGEGFELAGALVEPAIAAGLSSVKEQ